MDIKKNRWKHTRLGKDSIFFFIQKHIHVFILTDLDIFPDDVVENIVALWEDVEWINFVVYT